MKKIIFVLVTALVFTGPVFATWAMISLEELIKDTDLVVIGTLRSASENMDGIGRGQIVIDRVISSGARTFNGGDLQPGDKITIEWEDNWMCASGMHMSWRNRQGVFLLKVKKDGTVKAGYPGRFHPVDDLGSIAKILQRQKLKMSTAVKTGDESFQAIGAPAIFPIELVGGPDPSDGAMFRALLTALLSLALYRFLYRGRIVVR